MKLQHTCRFAVTIALCSTLTVLSGAAPSIAEMAAEPTQRASCIEVSDRAFTVRECLQIDRAATDSTAIPSLPDSFVTIMANELLWSPSLLREVGLMQEAQGQYTRTAWLGDQETRLDADRFFVSHSSAAELAQFSLRLEHPTVKAVEATYSQEGSGSLTFFDHVDGERTFFFETGKLVSKPEIAVTEKSSSFYMGCYIDSPAFDQYRRDFCFRLGSVGSIVSFRVFLPYQPSYYVWVTPSSSCSSSTCNVPISPGQTIGGYAYWVINGTPTGPVGAIAEYEYEPGY
ncbi:MAG: hypothetical protein HC897_00315 [Thermoanaerobaculia bacterium]|nr:hypothetical protein [Thermoanaerobaculia bacterium]